MKDYTEFYFVIELMVSQEKAYKSISSRLVILYRGDEGKYSDYSKQTQLKYAQRITNKPFCLEYNMQECSPQNNKVFLIT